MSYKKRMMYHGLDNKLIKMAEGGVISFAKLRSGLVAIRRNLTKARLQNFLQTYSIRLSSACKRLLQAEDKHLASLPDHFYA